MKLNFIKQSSLIEMGKLWTLYLKFIRNYLFEISNHDNLDILYMYTNHTRDTIEMSKSYLKIFKMD